MKTTWQAAMGCVMLLGGSMPAQAQQVHRNNFEAPKIYWIKAGADAPFDEIAHASTDTAAHDGRRSENLRLNVKPGTFVHYQYQVGKAPINDELSGSVWIKANRPGLQFMARVVLPNEREPSNLENRMSTVIRGDLYRNVDRWQRLDLGRPVYLLKQQQQLIQAQLKRPVNIADAYVDSVLVNVYGGPGPTEVWIDDLEIGPVVADLTNPVIPRPLETGPASTIPNNTAAFKSRGLAIEFNANQLLVGGKRFLMRGVNLTNTPARVLHQAGFNTIFVDYETNPTILKEANDLGLWIAPKLKVLSDDKLSSKESLTREIARLAENDAVLLYDFGGTHSFEHAVPISRAAQTVRTADPGRPLAAEVWDGMLPFSRSLNMLGVHRWPLMTTMELPKYREWLEQRRNLANPDAYVWTWIQNHLPDLHAQMLYDQPGNVGFKEPVGPQPEHVRLLTYTALAAGVRGVAYYSDRWLADSHQGRDRLLMCGLINQELEMLEPVLVSTSGDPQWVDTSSPDVKAAVMQTGKGVLVLPIWQGKGAQFVPGQAAVSKLSMIVPQVPQSMQCWEVTPGEVRGIKSERVPGGTKITVPEFGLTTALVFTNDTQQVVRFQELARARRQQAAQWTYDMALYELEKVVAVEKELEKQGHTLPDAAALVTDAQNRLQTAKQMWDNRVFADAYREAQRALRPLRILMRAQWEAATKRLDSPVSSPYGVTFYTLPRHWQFMDQVANATFLPNVLAGGDFEIVPERKQESWKLDEITLDEVELVPTRVSEVVEPVMYPSKKDLDLEKRIDGKNPFSRLIDPKDKGFTPKKGPDGRALQETKPGGPHLGKQCALLQIKAKNPMAAPQALERTLLAITSPPVQLQPGSLVKVSGWICIPKSIAASSDGALFYDSAGGEPFAIRLTEPTPWKQFTLYRRVPASGTMQVTLALTGIGSVYFDDVRIEPTAVPGMNVSTTQK